jgi:hypothetical protein
MAHGAAKYLLVLACPALLGQGLVREEKSLVVDGKTEVWRLVWKHPPKPACSPEGDEWMTCPCNGFSFGEAGRLDLVSIREGHEIDRLPLTPLFDEVPVYPSLAVVQRWPMLAGEAIGTNAHESMERIHARPAVDVMDLADYDHDGKSTEFFLQTGTLPCGKRVGVVIGLSAGNPPLHAFGSALHAEKPLCLRKEQWDALRFSAGQIRVVDWTCGDHGADTETEIELQATSAGIRAVSREFACDADGRRGKLLSETEL